LTANTLAQCSLFLFKGRICLNKVFKMLVNPFRLSLFIIRLVNLIVPFPQVLQGLFFQCQFFARLLLATIVETYRSHFCLVDSCAPHSPMKRAR
ncbi:MAG: hypothetical protein ACI309_08515, partial [Candidatus Limisoma sp.]